MRRCYLSVDGCGVIMLRSGYARDSEFAPSNQTADEDTKQQACKQQQVGDTKDCDT